jgi:hypothetical protein
MPRNTSTDEGAGGEGDGVMAVRRKLISAIVLDETDIASYLSHSPPRYRTSSVPS